MVSGGDDGVKVKGDKPAPQPVVDADRGKFVPIIESVANHRDPLSYYDDVIVYPLEPVLKINLTNHGPFQPSHTLDTKKDGKPPEKENPKTHRKDPDFPVHSPSLGELQYRHLLGDGGLRTPCITGSGPYVIEPYLKGLKQSK